MVSHQVALWSWVVRDAELKGSSYRTHPPATSWHTEACRVIHTDQQMASGGGLCSLPHDRDHSQYLSLWGQEAHIRLSPTLTYLCSFHHTLMQGGRDFKELLQNNTIVRALGFPGG